MVYHQIGNKMKKTRNKSKTAFNIYVNYMIGTKMQ